MITSEQFIKLETLFDYYNKELFDGKLNDCLINMSRLKGANGFFSPERWKNKEKNIHEISLTPQGLDREEKDWQATLVHEMVHLWQNDFGKPSRANYHNKEWANKMEEIGLIPSSTGFAGGKKTGQKMIHYVDVNGRFIKAFNALKEKKINCKPNPEMTLIKKTDNSKTKYICSCKNKVWGKPDLSIKCLICGSDFKQVEKDN